MTSRWDVKVDGRDHEIRVDRAENGKNVIRVDGRTVAKPLGDDEFERRFAVGGHEYVLSRTAGNAFDVTPARVLSHEKAAPMPEVVVAKLQRGGSMQPFVKYGWLAVVAIVAIILFVALGPNYPKQAGRRVETMLADIKDGSNRESQVSRGIWQRNVRTLDATELQAVDVAFTAWRQEKDFTSAFTSYRIVDTKNVKGAAMPTAIVTFEAGGRQFKVLVPERQRMQWAE